MSQAIKLYERLYKKKLPRIPEDYNSGELIGVVDLQDVIPLEKFKKLVPEPFNQECDQEFIFVLRNPRRLAVPIKMSEKSKIYDIPRIMIQKAIPSLNRSVTNWAPYHAQEFLEESLNRKDLGISVNRKQSKTFKKKGILDRYQIWQDLDTLKILETKEELLSTFILDIYDELGRSLKIGFDLRKSFELSSEVGEVLRKIYNEFNTRHLTSDEGSIDIFKLTLRDKQIEINKKYDFLALCGNAIKFSHFKKEFLLKEGQILYNHKKSDALIVRFLDKKKRGRLLKPKGDYDVVVVGISMDQSN